MSGDSAKPLPGVSMSEEPQIDLRAVLRVLRHHRWLIVAAVLAVTGLAALVTSQIRPQYTSTALVVVDSRDSQMLGFQPGISDGIAGNGLVDTEVEIARSAKVLERAAAALNISNAPDFARKRSLIEAAKALVGIASDAPPAKVGVFTDLSDAERARLVEALSKRVSVRRIGLTSVISMSATAFDPQMAATMANTLSDSYLTEQIASKVGSNERAAAFLRARVDGLAEDISSLETQIDNYISSKLAELGSPEAKALLVKLDQESRARRANSEALAQIQSAIQANDFARLAGLMATQQADLASRRAALQADLSSTNDTVQLAEAQRSLDALDKEIEQAALKRSTGLQTDIDLSEARSAQARSQISSSLTDTELPREVSLELFRLQRDADTSRSLYESYLTKLRQVEQQTDFTVPDSRVIASATPPSVPSYPPKRLIFTGSILFSLALGIGLAFLRENFIGGVTTEEQLEALTGIPVIGGIPLVKGGEAVAPDRMVVSQPLSAYAEAIRRVRLGVEANGLAGNRCVFVTSTLPGDGKTTVALSLARHFASTGVSTLLVDADLRHPHVHHLLEQDVEKGLIEFLSSTSGGDPNDQMDFTKEAATGLSFVLGGKASSVATDAMLMSNRFNDLMSYAKGAYDLVIVDTPPIGLVVDASLVARYCDFGIFVVRYASTGQQVLRRALRDLVRRTDVPISCVLNQVSGPDGYRYGYQRRYRHYYR